MEGVSKVMGVGFLRHSTRNPALKTHCAERRVGSLGRVEVLEVSRPAVTPNRVQSSLPHLLLNIMNMLLPYRSLCVT